MKITYSSTKEDFFIFYLSQIFFKKPVYLNEMYNFAGLFKIDKDEIRSLEVTDSQKKDFFEGKNFEEFKKYYFLYDFYKEVDEEKINIVLKSSENYLEKALWSLTELFGESQMSPNIEIAFVQYSIKNQETDLNAFTSKFLKNKIFLAFNDAFDIKDTQAVNYYIRVIIHELTHIFINENTSFQEIFKEEWTNKYKNINPKDYRFDIEELLTSSLIFPYKDFGFLCEDLGFEENLNKKEDSIKKNKYRKITFDFLEELKNSSDKDKLENLLPVYIDELIKGGLFLEE